jgi:uncharacterized protein (DUF1800 family)
MLKPISHSQWSEVHQAHLLNRAGFGTAPAAGALSIKDSPETWVNRLLDVPTQPDPEDAPAWTREPTMTPAEFKKIRQLPEQERREQFQALQRMDRRNSNSLSSWWMDRMLNGSYPFQEKMTLFWHGHFVSSRDKVKRGDILWQQNNLLRYQGLGSFRDLTISVGRDAAMLVYLDGTKSKRASPNENYARELMELFTLGEGHYTEEDIKEAARAFTGWTVNRISPKANFRERQFDDGIKNFFGKSGNFNDENIIDIILSEDQAARYLTKKLWEYFAYRNPEPEIIESLAASFKENDYQIKPVLKEMFLSQPFYSKQAMRTQIKSPIMWLSSLVRILDLEPFPSQIGTRMVAQLGQDLFNPPSVKGWDGGRAWISTTTMIMRNNLAHLLINGGNTSQAGLASKNVREIPAEVIESMTAEQKTRLERFKKKGQYRTIPSFLHNQSLTAAWEATSEKERLPLLVKEVYQGPVSQTTYRTLETNRNLTLSDGNTRQALKKNIYELVSHPEFQLT